MGCSFLTIICSKGDGRGKPKVVLINYRDLVLIKTHGDHLYWYTQDGAQVSLRMALNSIESKLEPHGILRCQRGWAVNRYYVESIRTLSSEQIFLKLSLSLSVLVMSKTVQKKFSKEKIEEVPLGKVYEEKWSDFITKSPKLT